MRLKIQKQSELNFVNRIIQSRYRDWELFCLSGARRMPGIRRARSRSR